LYSQTAQLTESAAYSRMDYLPTQNVSGAACKRQAFTTHKFRHLA
jgi:hypothetical protein